MINTGNANHLFSMNLVKVAVYFSVLTFTTLPKARINAFSLLLFFNMRELIMGVNDNVMKVDMTTAPTTTMANSRNNCPVKPGIKKMGKNTQTKVMEVAIT